MSTNAFIGKKEKPNETDLAATLGPAKAAWDQLLFDLAQENDVKIHEWKSYSLKAGWSLRAKRKERTIVWLSPCTGCFMASFILGGKAMEVARQVKWPKAVVKAINEAPKYAEGTGIRLKVKSPKDLGTIKKLAAIKLAN